MSEIYSYFIKKLFFFNSKIHFTNKVNFSSVPSNLTQKTYLLEEGYDYNYSNILYNNIQESNKKDITLDLSNFYHNLNSDFSQNITSSY